MRTRSMIDSCPRFRPRTEMLGGLNLVQVDSDVTSRRQKLVGMSDLLTKRHVFPLSKIPNRKLKCRGQPERDFVQRESNLKFVGQQLLPSE